MGELNLDAIRRNADWYRRNRGGREGAVEAYPWSAAAIACAEDVPALLVEVERLRGELDAIGDLAYRFSYHESPSAVEDLLVAIVGRAKRAARGGESDG